MAAVTACVTSNLSRWRQEKNIETKHEHGRNAGNREDKTHQHDKPLNPLKSASTENSDNRIIGKKFIVIFRRKT